MKRLDDFNISLNSNVKSGKNVFPQLWKYELWSTPLSQYNCTGWQHMQLKKSVNKI